MHYLGVVAINELCSIEVIQKIVAVILDIEKKQSKGICIGANYVFLDGKHFVSAVGCEQCISILRYGQYGQVGADGVWRNKEVNNAKTADKKTTIKTDDIN